MWYFMYGLNKKLHGIQKDTKAKQPPFTSTVWRDTERVKTDTDMADILEYQIKNFKQWIGAII
jgi:hypothetical protein